MSPPSLEADQPSQIWVSTKYIQFEGLIFVTALYRMSHVACVNHEFIRLETLMSDSGSNRDSESTRENSGVPFAGSDLNIGSNIDASLTSHNMDMGDFTGGMDMDMGSFSGGRSVSVETTKINGRTIEKTTVVENGVTTVTTREF